MKKTLHPRSFHLSGYDFQALIAVCPELGACIQLNPSGKETIDFSNRHSVYLLNKALLLLHYQYQFWELPKGYLCPAVPGRADYLHYLADFLDQQFPSTQARRIFDLGVGASCIYPLIGQSVYDWRFVGTDINKASIKSALEIVQQNKISRNKIELRLQEQRNQLLKGVVAEKEVFDALICNPPFFSSAAEAEKANMRKQRGLKRGKVEKAKFNFGGQHQELYCKGGEIAFIKRLIRESQVFRQQFYCFSSLVSQSKHLKILQGVLRQSKINNYKIIEMGQGQKQSRILIWWF